MTSDKHDKLFSSSPPIPEFLHRQTPDPRDEQIADLAARLAEAERERDAANFDKARMLDERQIFLKGMDDVRARLAASERASERRRETAMGFARQIQELRDEVARLTAQMVNACDSHCDRVLCVMRREVDRMREDAARWKHWLDNHGWSGCFDDGASNSESKVDIIAACDKERAEVARLAQRWIDTSVEGRNIHEWVAAWNTEKQARETAEAEVARLKDDKTSLWGTVVLQNDIAAEENEAREAAESRLRELREWIAIAHHLPLCAKWSYALDDQMQLVPVLVHDAECTCGRDSILDKSGEP